MQDLELLFKRNQDWANHIKDNNPAFFDESAKGQSPDYLWIGCADSRVPPNTITNLLPGEIFVHRNIANVISHDDLNALSVIQYAVEVLKVKHVIVCGHYGCGGVKASTDGQNHGLIDNWLRHIQDVSLQYADELNTLSGEEKTNRLCELNVIQQVKNISRTTPVQQAWKNEQPLTVHGIIYDLKDGTLSGLDCSVSSKKTLEEMLTQR